MARAPSKWRERIDDDVAWPQMERRWEWSGVDDGGGAGSGQDLYRLRQCSRKGDHRST